MPDRTEDIIAINQKAVVSLNFYYTQMGRSNEINLHAVSNRHP